MEWPLPSSNRVVILDGNVNSMSDEVDSPEHPDGHFTLRIRDFPGIQRCPSPTWTCPHLPAMILRTGSDTLQCQRCKREFPSVSDAAPKPEAQRGN
jgi:hypothetical protein